MTDITLTMCGDGTSTQRTGAMMQSESAKNEDTPPSPSGGAGGEPALGPFSEERARIDRIVDRLDVTDDLIERADLGTELVRSLSRYEDTFERVLLPRLERSDPKVISEIEHDRDQLREDMDDIHQRTMGIDARNVHTSDGQGFEDTLAAVVVALRALLEIEDREIAALMESLGTEERQQLAGDVSHAFRSASERPRPPRTAVGRFLSNTHVKLDHVLEDVATPQHPGSDTVKG